MTKPTYAKIAADFRLWGEYMDAGTTMSRAEFDSMSVAEKVALQVEAFGVEKYTIAYTDGMLLACVPDSADIYAAIVSAVPEMAGHEHDDDVHIESGLVLTDDEPADCRYRAGGSAFPMLESADGSQYRYAARA